MQGKFLSQQYIRLALYYAVNIIECIGVSVVWWTYSVDKPYHEMGFGMLIGGTAVSIIFMVLYYALGHPNRKNTWGWVWCSRKCGNSQAEETDI